MHWPNTLSLVVFVTIVFVVAIAVVTGITASYPADKRFRVGLVAGALMATWMGLTAGIAASGIWHVPEPFPRLAPYAATNLLVAFGLGLSPVGRRLADNLPIAALVLFHVFRLPLELVLHSWAVQGSVPHDISYLGQNFDIVPAVLAVLVAPFAKRAPWLVLIFEIVGAAMLLNILRIVALNVPGSPFFVPHGEPPLLLPAYAPTTWIVSVCVTFAIAGHVVIGVWLWRRFRQGAPGPTGVPST